MSSKAKASREEEALEPQAEYGPPTPRPRTPEATLLLLFGFLAMAAGGALSLGPRFSWKLDQIAVGFDYLGVHGGTLLMSGLVLVALGMVWRAISLQLATLSGPSDTELSLNQIASELAHVRANLLHLGEQVRAAHGAVGESHQATSGELQQLAQHVTAAAKAAAAAAQGSGASDKGSADAIYRMAAGIDQLWAKIDQRMRAQFQDLRNGVERQSQGLASLQQQIDGLGSELQQWHHEAAAPAAPQPRHEPAEAWDAPSEPRSHEGPSLSPSETWGSDEEPSLGLLDELSEPSSPLPGGQADAGVLDALRDMSRHARDDGA